MSADVGNEDDDFGKDSILDPILKSMCAVNHVIFLKFDYIVQGIDEGSVYRVHNMQLQSVYEFPIADVPSFVFSWFTEQFKRFKAQDWETSY